MKLNGCYTAVVTPFAPDGTVDEEGFRKNIEFLIEREVAGIVPCGTTGESATLSWEEHLHVVDIAIDQTKKRVQVIAGAGSNSTSESVRAARHAAERGADAILCITPYYNRPTQEGLYQHFRTVANEVDIPMVLYNVPSRTGINLNPATLERLCDFDNIAAIKEASGNIVQVSEMHKRCGDRIAILSGDDALTLPILSVGGTGVISVTANILPHRMVALIKAYQAGLIAEALSIHEELLPISNALFIETNPIPVKTAMNAMGLHAGGLRLPLVAMAEENKAALLRVLTESGLLPKPRK
jgi:4-hydroxy-tetrahydrodipicolinate synthase